MNHTGVFNGPAELGDLGLGVSLTRTVAGIHGSSDDGEQLNRAVGTTFFSFCTAGLVFLVVGLSMSPYIPSWFKTRLELARLLAKTQRLPEAMREAKICLQLRPQLKAAEKLVADFSVHPATFSEEIESP